MKIIFSIRFCLLISLFTCPLFSVIAHGQVNGNPLAYNLQRTENNPQKLKNYEAICKAYQYSNPDSAVFYSKQGLTLFTARDYKPGMASMLACLSMIYSDQKMPDLAQKSIEKALKIYTGLRDDKGIATSYNILGVIFSRNARYYEATNQLLKSLKLVESFNDSTGMTNAYLNLGINFEHAGDKVMAFVYYNKGLDLINDQSAKDSAIFLNSNIKSLFNNKKDNFISRKYANKLLEKGKDTSYIEVLSLPSPNMGVVYAMKGDTAKAFSYDRHALAMAIKDNGGIVYSYFSADNSEIKKKASHKILPGTIESITVDRLLNFGTKPQRTQHQYLASVVPTQINIATGAGSTIFPKKDVQNAAGNERGTMTYISYTGANNTTENKFTSIPVNFEVNPISSQAISHLPFDETQSHTGTLSSTPIKTNVTWAEINQGPVNTVGVLGANIANLWNEPVNSPDYLNMFGTTAPEFQNPAQLFNNFISLLFKPVAEKSQNEYNTGIVDINSETNNFESAPSANRTSESKLPGTYSYLNGSEIDLAGTGKARNTDILSDNEENSRSATTGNEMNASLDQKNYSENSINKYIRPVNISDRDVPDNFIVTEPQYNSVVLNESLKIAEKSTLEKYKVGHLENLIELSKKKGDYKKAFSLMEQQKILLDSLLYMDSELANTNIATWYDINKLNSKVQQLEISDQKEQQGKYLTALFAGLVTVVLGVVGFFWGRTKLINKELSTRETRLVNASNTKNKLISVIAHDITGSIGFMPLSLSLCKDKSLPEEEKYQLLNQLELNAISSFETLQNLLDWGKAQLQGISIAQANLNADKLLSEVLPFIAIGATNKQITIKNNVNPGVMVFADPDHFKFILRNLLSNAVKYSYPNGLIEINCQKSADFAQIVFSVKDNGTGISKDKAGQIFESSLHSEVGTDNEKGNGIGLKLCKEFAVENGGDIWVESEKGRGSVFYFSLKAPDNLS